MNNAELREFCTQMIGRFKLLSDIQKEMQYETIDAKFTEWELKKLIFALNVLREEVRKYVDTADTPQTDEFKNFDREDLILLIECQKERIAELLAKDEPQTCSTCKYDEDKRFEVICNTCNSHRNHYKPKDEPHTDCAWR